MVFFFRLHRLSLQILPILFNSPVYVQEASEYCSTEKLEMLLHHHIKILYLGFCCFLIEELIQMTGT